MDLLTSVNDPLSCQLGFKGLEDFSNKLIKPCSPKLGDPKMNKMRSYSVAVFLLLVLVPAPHWAYGHSMFNSAEKFHGGYRVQVATAPEFPQLDEPSQFLLRVTDEDYEEVDRFTMGIKFFYNDQQIDAIPPKSHSGGHWDFDYIWTNPGNHIVEIILYDMPGSLEPLSYKFNMGTQSPFGYIFIIAITIGALCFAGVMGYIYLPRLKKSRP